MMNTRNGVLAACVSLALSMPLAAQTDDQKKTDSWLPSLITETPQEGFELAITLSRKGVTRTQSDKETLFRERALYSQSGEDLMHASEVIAIHFQTVAAANNYWKQ